DAEGGLDVLKVNTLGGNDVLDASGLTSNHIQLTVNGGAGNDTLTGSAGDDTFVWNPGDGSDTIDGGDGLDTLTFNGSHAAEQFDLSANGNRVRFLRVLANTPNVTMDLNGVEQVDLSARGGADTIVVNDLSATDLTALNLDLDGPLDTGVGDGARDSVTVNGTAGGDAVPIVVVLGNGSHVAIGGLFAFVTITGSEGGNDTLTVNTLGGNDLVDASDLAATNATQLIRLTVIGGAGNDILIGSPGPDTFVWNAGDGSDTIDGGAGNDTMVVNGSNLSERVDVSANGPPGRGTRGPDRGTMGLGGAGATTHNPPAR